MSSSVQSPKAFVDLAGESATSLDPFHAVVQELNNKSPSAISGYSPTRKNDDINDNSITLTDDFARSPLGRTKSASTAYHAESSGVDPPQLRSPPSRSRSGPLYTTVPQERKRRVHVALDAAKVGQMTRLREAVVEATAQDRSKLELEKEKDWTQRKGLAQTNLVRSNFFQVIHEAAATGRMKGLKPVEIVTNEKILLHPAEENDVSQPNKKKINIKRASLLVDSYVIAQKELKKDELLSAEAQLERLDELEASRSQLSLLSPVVPTWSKNKRKVEIALSPSGAAPSKGMPFLGSPTQSGESNGEHEPSNSINAGTGKDALHGPSSTSPRAFGTFSDQGLPPHQPITPQQARQLVSKEAAGFANDRTVRILQCQTIKVTKKCTCGYCKNPSPYQTQYYKHLSEFGADRKEEAVEAAQKLQLLSPDSSPTNADSIERVSPKSESRVVEISLLSPEAVTKPVSFASIPESLLEEDSDSASSESGDMEEEKQLEEEEQRHRKKEDFATAREAVALQLKVLTPTQRVSNRQNKAVNIPLSPPPEKIAGDEAGGYLKALDPVVPSEESSLAAVPFLETKSDVTRPPDDHFLDSKETSPSGDDPLQEEEVEYQSELVGDLGNTDVDDDDDDPIGEVVSLGDEEGDMDAILSSLEENASVGMTVTSGRVSLASGMPSLAEFSYDENWDDQATQTSSSAAKSLNHTSTSTGLSAAFSLGSSTHSQTHGEAPDDPSAREGNPSVTRQTNPDLNELAPTFNPREAGPGHPRHLATSLDRTAVLDMRPTTPKRLSSSSDFSQVSLNEPAEDVHDQSHKSSSIRPKARESTTESTQQDNEDAKELSVLLHNQGEGLPIDENRLYELQLFDWHKNGWALTDEEIRDLEKFKEQRNSVAGTGDTKEAVAPIDVSNRSRRSSSIAEDPLEFPNHKQVAPISNSAAGGEIARFDDSSADPTSDSDESFQSEPMGDDTIHDSGHDSNVLSQFLQNQMKEIMLEDEDIISKATFEGSTFRVDSSKHVAEQAQGNALNPFEEPMKDAESSSSQESTISKSSNVDSSSDTSVASEQENDTENSMGPSPSDKSNIFDEQEDFNQSFADAPEMWSSKPAVGKLIEPKSQNSPIEAGITPKGVVSLNSHIATAPDFLAEDFDESTWPGDTKLSLSAASTPVTSGPELYQKVEVAPSKNFEDSSSGTTSSLASEDQRRQESEDLDELNDLYDRRDTGEEIDENRLYELELFDRYRQGEQLDPTEIQDLTFYKRRKRRIEKQVKEFNELCDAQDAGDEVDHDRMYLLELVVRDRLGESLTAEESDDLRNFEKQSENSENTINPITRKALSEKPQLDQKIPESASKSYQKATLSTNENITDKVRITPKNDTTEGDHDDSSLSSREIDELNDLLDQHEEGKPVDKQRMRELDLFDRWLGGETLDQLDGFELQIYRKKRRKERAYRREFQQLLMEKENGERVDEYRLSCLALFARQYIGQDLTDDEFSQLEEFKRQERSIEAALKAREAGSQLPGDAHMGALESSVSVYAERLKEKGDETDSDERDEEPTSPSTDPGLVGELESEPWNESTVNTAAVHASETPPADDEGEDSLGFAVSEDGFIEIPEDNIWTAKQEPLNISIESDPWGSQLGGTEELHTVQTLVAQERDETFFSDLKPFSQDEDSSLSDGELSELDTLAISRRNGNTIDESRFADLMLFKKWQQAEVLNSMDATKLHQFKSKREIERGYRKEFQELLDKKEKGESVSEDRLRDLQLYARRYVGSNLGPEELQKLQAFEDAEEILRQKDLALMQPSNERQSVEDAVWDSLEQEMKDIEKEKELMSARETKGLSAPGEISNERSFFSGFFAGLLSPKKKNPENTPGTSQGAKSKPLVNSNFQGSAMDDKLLVQNLASTETSTDFSKIEAPQQLEKDAGDKVDESNELDSYPVQAQVRDRAKTNTVQVQTNGTEAQEQAKGDADRKHLMEAEARVWLEAEQQTKAVVGPTRLEEEAEAQSAAEAKERDRVTAKEQAKADSERKRLRERAEVKARAEAEALAKAAVDRKSLEEVAEAKARSEVAERRAREELEEKAKVESERKRLKAEADDQAEAERKRLEIEVEATARAEAEAEALEQARTKVRSEEAEKRAREALEKQAEVESERKRLKEEADRRARATAEDQAEAERKRLEDEVEATARAEAEALEHARAAADRIRREKEVKLQVKPDTKERVSVETEERAEADSDWKRSKEDAGESASSVATTAARVEAEEQAESEFQHKEAEVEEQARAFAEGEEEAERKAISEARVQDETDPERLETKAEHKTELDSELELDLNEFNRSSTRDNRQPLRPDLPSVTTNSEGRALNQRQVGDKERSGMNHPSEPGDDLVEARYLAEMRRKKDRIAIRQAETDRFKSETMQNVSNQVLPNTSQSDVASSEIPDIMVNSQTPLHTAGAQTLRNQRPQHVKKKIRSRTRRSRLKIAVRPLLSWRSDPSESFSDWTIELRAMGSRETNIYHIHRNIVGFGPRKSGYFAKLFVRHDAALRSNPGTGYLQSVSLTKLALPTAEAEVWEIALDYMYLTDGETHPKLTAERACASFKLAQRLEMPTLQTVLAEFYRKNLTIPNMGKFFRAANRLNCERLVFVAKARIGSMVTDDPTLARLLKPRFLCELANILDAHRQKVMEHVQRYRPDTFRNMEISQSRRWSIAIYHCCVAKDNSPPADVFDNLTKESLLPVVDGGVALGLLRLGISTHAPKRNDVDSREYSNFERRCTLGILREWKAFESSFDSRSIMMSELKSLPSHILADVLLFSQTGNIPSALSSKE